MYSGICICVLLAVLSASSTGQQTVGSMNEDTGVREIEQQNILQHPRHIRASSSGQLKSLQRIDGNGDQKAIFGAMLAKYLQTRKGKMRLFVSYSTNLPSSRCFHVKRNFPPVA
ncbi:unnamed protein product [Staurois parvus]|uniref:Gastrin/cholecystokinin peptide hormone domain-containing protein n=1 Tax=Staurois parvus TaxID=386267 RepID=A0ABN9E9M2_9NEOB|nr:unnamed protein product [Staurois parvus]